VEKIEGSKMTGSPGTKKIEGGWFATRKKKWENPTGEEPLTHRPLQRPENRRNHGQGGTPTQKRCGRQAGQGKGGQSRR